MTPAELDDRLNAMALEGATDPTQMPGLITIKVTIGWARSMRSGHHAGP
jgi:hypothetical protein